MFNIPGITVNLDDDSVAARLRDHDYYDLFMTNVNRSDKLANDLFVFIDRDPGRNRADWYLYYVGFDNPADNGFILVSVIDPNDHPALVNEVHRLVQETFTSRIRTLYLDAAEMRN